MSGFDLCLLVVTGGLFVYLLAALIFPENFS